MTLLRNNLSSDFAGLKQSASLEHFIL